MIYERQEEFVNSLFTLAMLNETRREIWSQVTKQHMHNMSDHLFTAFEKFFLTAAEVRANDTIEIWSFSTAIFFSVTVVTTIGKVSVGFILWTNVSLLQLTEFFSLKSLLTHQLK